MLEDGTGVPLDGVGVVALEGAGLSIMVGGGNARSKRTEDGRGYWWDKFRIVFFQWFNDNDRITSKLPIPVYPAKRMVPNPLISMQSSSLPLKQDMTKQSCANLVKRIRNPLGVRSSAPPRDDTLNNCQRSMLAAASPSDELVLRPLDNTSWLKPRSLSDFT